MSLRIDGRYKKTATISDEQKIYELSQIWKDAEHRYYSMLPVYLVKIGDEFTVLRVEKDAEVTMKERTDYYAKCSVKTIVGGYGKTGI